MISTQDLKGLQALTVEAVVENLRLFQVSGTELSVRGAMGLLDNLGRADKIDRQTIQFMRKMLEENSRTSAEWNLVGMILQFEALAQDIRNQ